MSESTAGAAGSRMSPDELATQVGFLEAEVTDLRRRLTDVPGQSRDLEQRLADTQRSLAGADEPERAARPDAARGARPDHDAQGRGRPARPAADRLRHLPEPQRRRHGRRVHRRSQAAGQRQSRRRRSTTWSAGQEVMLNEALNVVAALEFEKVGEVVMLKELLDDGRACAGDRQRRRGTCRAPRRSAARGAAEGRRLAAARRPRQLRLRARAQDRGRGARPRRGARHRLRQHRWPDRADRRRSATPSSCPTCTRSCSRSTSSSRPRACCSTALPAVARR